MSAVCSVSEGWPHFTKVQTPNQQTCALAVSEMGDESLAYCLQVVFVIGDSAAQAVFHLSDPELDGVLFWLRVPSSIFRQLCPLLNYEMQHVAQSGTRRSCR